MATLKYSRQRESIKEFLRTRTDHPTADVVYENMKLIYPNISLGTVYRNLSLLADLGEIKKLSSFAGADHFDGRTERHCHLSLIHILLDIFFLSNVIEADRRRYCGWQETEKERWKKLCVEIPGQDCGLCVC